MDLKTRRIIYSIFIAVFIIVAPFVVLYAAGYRYDWKRGKLLQTGGIYLIVKTPKTKIYLGGELIKETGIFFNNEVRLNNLLPNNYRLTVSKDGFYSWEKNLTVRSQETTFAEHINLFRQNQPREEIDEPSELINISPNQKYLIYSGIKREISGLWLWDKEKKSKELLYRINKNSLENLNYEELVKWSSDSKKILLAAPAAAGGNSHFVINAENPAEIILVENIAKQKFNAVFWVKNGSNSLYAISKNIIYEIDLPNNTVAQFITSENEGEIVDLWRENDDFYYTLLTDTETLLLKKNVWSGEQIILRLTANPYKFIAPGPKNIFSLYDDKNKEVLLIDKTTSEVLLQEKALGGEWEKTQERFLYYKNFELWFYEHKEDKNELISRYSQEIKKARWVPALDYITFLLGDALKIIELDGRDKRNFYNLADEIRANNFLLTENGETVYLSSDKDKGGGLYELVIQ
ncbi:MAG: carboxypeptidase-like regulatory domain-containing protein [Patescibacteria group bacterium]|nr:carboxypeptidase-like regulatory domain-containing protein [Patescibacteria group bacterium]MDD5490712.1 carboxypeptidase-like regulatory domain-containing protein [Patescibacteria group bacterium]